MQDAMNHFNITSWILTHRHISTLTQADPLMCRVAACKATYGEGIMILQYNEPCETVASGHTGIVATMYVSERENKRMPEQNLSVKLNIRLDLLSLFQLLSDIIVCVSDSYLPICQYFSHCNYFCNI